MYVLTSTQNSKTYTNSKTFTFTVTNSNPTFSNFTYEDTNSATIALTGNNQKIINRYSNLKVTISSSNKMVAKNSATAKYYNIITDNKTTSVNYSSSDVSTTINNVNTKTVGVTAYDSRGNKANVTKNISYINYSEVLLKTLSIQRKDGIGSTILITANGTYDTVNFGAVTNSIDTITLRYKKSTESNYTEVAIKNLFTIDTEKGTITASSQEISESLASFDLVKYDIQIVIKDELSSSYLQVTLDSGSPILSAVKEKGIGINKIYDTSIDASLQIKGAVELNGIVLDVEVVDTW